MKTRFAKLLMAAAFVHRAGFWAEARRRRCMAVLCYHRVGAQPDPLGLTVTLSEFRRQLDVITSSKYLVAVNAHEFEALWKGQRAYGERVPVLITFDDGYRDNLTLAGPLLAASKIPAILFVATDLLQGGALWYDVIEQFVATGAEASLAGELPDLRAAHGAPPSGARQWVDAVLGLDAKPYAHAIESINALRERTNLSGRYVSAADLEAWCAMGMALGAHSCSHPRLTGIGADQARREMQESRAVLEAIVKFPVTHFAYPFGRRCDFSPEHESMLAGLGFGMSFSTVAGRNRAGDNPFAVRRKCVDAGLFAHAAAGFSPTLFLADLMGVGAMLRSKFKVDHDG